MPKREQVVRVIISLIGVGVLFSLLVGCRWADYPFSVPVRPMLGTKDVSLLWVKETNITDPHFSGVTLFTPNDQSVVFWSPQLGSLIALDLVTGETLWKTKVPAHSSMRLYDDKFFVASYQWFNELEDAPIHANQVFPDCSFGGKASLLTYNPHTGEQLWGYVYNGVNDNDIFFDDQNVYLTGSNDHGNSRSIAEIDINSGELLNLECNKWPEKKEITQPPENEGRPPFPYRVAYNEDHLRWRGILLFFFPEGNRLNILNGNTNEVLGYVDFGGAELNPYHIDIAVQNDIAVIYFSDSEQLFSLGLPDLEEMRKAYEINKSKLEEDCCCD